MIKAIIESDLKVFFGLLYLAIGLLWAGITRAQSDFPMRLGDLFVIVIGWPAFFLVVIFDMEV